MEEEHITEKRESSDSSARRNNGMMKRVLSKGPQFYPALYIQRYNLVQKLLQDHKIKSVSLLLFFFKFLFSPPIMYLII